jgi:drug/metabolite transporter (DMT)-like permease
VLHENFGLQSLIGGVLVLAGILLSKLGDRKIL